MARWHVWLTFLLGTANSALWIWQGLHGAPRRFAVLPHRYDDVTQAGVPLAIGLALTQLLFAWNIVQTIRGKGVDRVPSPAARAEWSCSIGRRRARAARGAAFGWAAGHSSAKSAATTAAVDHDGTAGGGGQPPAGKAVFASAGCAGCHTLADGRRDRHGRAEPRRDEAVGRARRRPRHERQGRDAGVQGLSSRRSRSGRRRVRLLVARRQVARYGRGEPRSTRSAWLQSRSAAAAPSVANCSAIIRSPARRWSSAAVKPNGRFSTCS